MQKFLYQDLFALEEKHWWHIAKRKLVKALLSTNRIGKKNKILDVGCGTGKNLEMLSSSGSTWGIDASAEALKFCQKRKLKNISVQSALKTKFRSGTFDLITMLDVLEHVDETAALLEAKRILKPQGKLLITVPAYKWLWSQWDVVLKHKRRYTKGTLEYALKKNGYKVKVISYFHSYLVLPTFIVRTVKGLVSGKKYSSDFGHSNILMNSIFGTLASLEQPLVIKGRVPFGLSLVCLAVRT